MADVLKTDFFIQLAVAAAVILVAWIMLIKIMMPVLRRWHDRLEKN